MKRSYAPPKLTKYETPTSIPEHIRSQLLLAPTVFHDLINLIQVITGECEMIEEAASPEINNRIRVIRNAAQKMFHRLGKSA